MLCSLGSATASYAGRTLTVSTGRMTRVWQLTPAGLVTRRIADDEAGFNWPILSARTCDWQLPGVGDDPAVTCRLESLDIRQGDDEGFSSPHLAVTLDLWYPGPATRVRCVIWAWPEMPGLRTQLQLRPGVSARVRALEATGLAEHLPVEVGDAEWHAAGYYNHTQARNQPGLDLLAEWRRPAPHEGPEEVDWASLASVRRDSHVLAVVKESHKCVNQPGCDTGGFLFEPAAGLGSTGWGIAGSALDPRAFHPAWGHWCLCASGEDADLAFQRAVKRLDRARFGFDSARDVYMISNTWGSRGQTGGRGSRDAATEQNVLREIDAAAQLGIDVVQIDDGWQVTSDARTWRPDPDRGWRPHPTMYPDGWANVRARAARRGVRLGLWAAAQWISLDEMVESFRAGGFRQWKLDFADLPRHEDVRELTEKVRAFALATGHRVRMNFDATENPPRFGYYFGREFGCCYLENRKSHLPQGVVYVPHLVLRDLWQLAHFANLQRFQGTIQNVRTVDPDHSDARLHPQAYAVAIPLAATPVFFLELQTYDDADRAEIQPLLAAYRAERGDMYRGLVHPLGHQPDNRSWCGFQIHRDNDCAGHLLIFRERLSEQPARSLRLHDLTGEAVEITNCLTGESLTQALGPDGEVDFEIPETPGFRFLRYRTPE